MFLLDIKGKYACFNAPDKNDKQKTVSYPVITPTAAIGLMSSVYWHPGMRWNVKRIYIVNPIRFTKPIFTKISDEVKKLSKVILTDVHYVVALEFEILDDKENGLNVGKITDITKRRFKRGQGFNESYLGFKEFPAKLSLYQSPEKSIPVPEELRDRKIKIPNMIYEVDYINSQPHYFDAIIDNGVITSPKPRETKKPISVVFTPWS